MSKVVVEITAKKGPNAGSKFLACENFPEFSFMRDEKQ
jgi:hypothetical protein